MSIQRQGNDLILSLHDSADTVKVYVMNSFGAETSSAMEMLSDAVENVSDMYSLADNSDLTGKAA